MKNIVVAGGYKDTVTAVADIIVLDHGAGGIPELNTVATVIYTWIGTANDGVTLHHRIFRTFKINADQVVFQPIAVDQDTVSIAGNKNATVLGGQAGAGIPHRYPAHGNIGCSHSNNPAHALAIDNTGGGTGQFQWSVYDDCPCIYTGLKQQAVAGFGPINGLLQCPLTRHHRPVLCRKRCRQAGAQ